MKGTQQHPTKYKLWPYQSKLEIKVLFSRYMKNEREPWPGYASQRYRVILPPYTAAAVTRFQSTGTCHILEWCCQPDEPVVKY